jgi:hypothetical protein
MVTIRKMRTPILLELVGCRTTQSSPRDSGLFCDLDPSINWRAKFGRPWRDFETLCVRGHWGSRTGEHCQAAPDSATLWGIRGTDKGNRRLAPAALIRRRQKTNAWESRRAGTMGSGRENPGAGRSAGIPDPGALPARMGLPTQSRRRDRRLQRDRTSGRHRPARRRTLLRRDAGCHNF